MGSSGGLFRICNEFSDYRKSAISTKEGTIIFSSLLVRTHEVSRQVILRYYYVTKHKTVEVPTSLGRSVNTRNIFFFVKHFL